jgi:hypothetical protein
VKRETISVYIDDFEQWNLSDLASFKKADLIRLINSLVDDMRDTDKERCYRRCPFRR